MSQKGRCLIKESERKLEVICDNLFNIEEKIIAEADIVILETDLPPNHYSNLCMLLSKMRKDARILSYLNLKQIWMVFTKRMNNPDSEFPFLQLASNISQSDRFSTSWSVDRGHHFFLWVKT